MSYLIILIIISPKFSKNTKNEQISPWPKRNLIALSKMMMNIQNKWAIDLGHKKGQQNKNVINKSIKYNL